MSCIIYPSPVFGPIHSRRLGTSLGINLLPDGGKLCSFDCLYCECGYNKDHRDNTLLPSREKVITVLERKLQRLKSDGVKLDVFTFAGNGEPTSHPDFEEIVDDVIKLRDKYYPEARITVLSNATFLDRDRVVRALRKVDNNIQKLDTVDQDFIRMLDRPNRKYDVRKVVERLKEFDSEVIIQTMFLNGEFEGKKFNNTEEKYVKPWLEAIGQIRPKEVMIYTLARETPLQTLAKASKEELDRIGEEVEKLGIPVQITY